MLEYSVYIKTQAFVQKSATFKQFLFTFKNFIVIFIPRNELTRVKTKGDKDMQDILLELLKALGFC